MPSRRGVIAFLLGFVLIVAGLAASWAQDVVAPWVNEAEADMRSSLRFESGGGDYRVITSGPSRPAVRATTCTITTADGEARERLGGQGVNESERLGVSRVLGFEAPAGRTVVLCSDRYSRSSAHGRFQVVSADGPVSVAVYACFGLGTLFIVAGILLTIRAFRRGVGASSGPPSPASA